jgi:hypothetical protein
MRNLIWAAPALLLGMQICASAATILPDTEIVVRSDQPIDAHIWDEGRTYPAHVAQNVFAGNGDLAIPAGSSAELVVHESGPNQMALGLVSVTVNGALYTTDTGVSQLRKQKNGALVPVYSTLKFRLAEPLRMFD